MAFPKGRPNPNAGRPKGVPNTVTEEMRKAWTDSFLAFQDGGAASLMEWGRANPGDFYKLAMRLIPMQVQTDVTSNGETVRHWTIELPQYGQASQRMENVLEEPTVEYFPTEDIFPDVIKIEEKKHE